MAKKCLIKMNIRVHLITSVILASMMYFFVGFHSLWIIVGGYLIDFDHYLWYVYIRRNFSLKNAYYYHLDRHKQKDYEKDLLHIFHTWEFWLIVLAGAIGSYVENLEFFFYAFSMMLLGIILHISLDFTHLVRLGHLDARAISFFKWLNRRN